MRPVFLAFSFLCAPLFLTLTNTPPLREYVFAFSIWGSKISTIEMLNKKKIIYHLSPHFVGIDDVSANALCVLQRKITIGTHTKHTQRYALTKQRKSRACLPLVTSLRHAMHGKMFSTEIENKEINIHSL